MDADEEILLIKWNEGYCVLKDRCRGLIISTGFAIEDVSVKFNRLGVGNRGGARRTGMGIAKL